MSFCFFRTTSVVAFLVTLGSLFFGACAEESSVDMEVGESDQALLGATPTSARPEVGSYQTGMGYCTATLIAPRYFISAAHCASYVARLNNTGSLTITGTDGASHLYPVERVYAFDASTGYGDVALGRLATAVSASVATPAVIGQGSSPAGNTTVTAIGYGCTDRATQALGGKRYRTFPWSNTNILCKGDSGGPVFLGDLNAGGVIVALASGTNSIDVYANPLQFKDRIEQTIRDLEGGLEVGWDRPGADYYDFTMPAGSIAASCAVACTNDYGCHAFTFSPSTLHCWLKNAMPTAVPNAAYTSGIPFATANNDRRGGDYTSYAVVRADICQADCARDTRCVAFNFLNGTCWLKNVLEGVSTCTSCTSGIIRVGENGDRPGSDLRMVSVSSVRACATECGKEEGCQAYSFVSTNGNCYLKYAVPALVANSNVLSGIRRGYEFNVNRGGSDYSSFSLRGPVPELCQSACAKDSRCLAWTLTTPPTTTDPRCWLKNSIPAAATYDGMISGRKGMEAF